MAAAGMPGPFVTGAPVNLAKRLEQAAGPGEVLLGASTLRLVKAAVSVEQLPPLRLGDERVFGVWRLIEFA